MANKIGNIECNVDVSLSMWAALKLRIAGLLPYRRVYTEADIVIAKLEEIELHFPFTGIDNPSFNKGWTRAIEEFRYQFNRIKKECDYNQVS